MELHVNLAELLGFLFKTHGEGFFPAFEELLLPSVLEMARTDSLPEDRKVRRDTALLLHAMNADAVWHGIWCHLDWKTMRPHSGQ